MCKKFSKYLCLILAILIVFSSFSACGTSEIDSQAANTNSENSSSEVMLFFEALQDNDVVPYTLTEKAKVMLSENESLFLNNSFEGLDAYTDTSLEYKILTKNIDKHGDKLMFLPEVYVASIDETQLDEDTVASELHLVDIDENSYYVFSLCAYDDIFEGDIICAYALPVGKTAFENIGGGTTLAIVLAGCYIEKIEQ